LNKVNLVVDENDVSNTNEGKDTTSKRGENQRGESLLTKRHAEKKDRNVWNNHRDVSIREADKKRTRGQTRTLLIGKSRKLTR